MKPRWAIVGSALPPNTTVYAIGDVHGCLTHLERLLTAIEADAHNLGAANPTLIFLGDLIDRGPDSAGVVERLIRLKERWPTSRFLMGNHEELFLAALAGDDRALKAFCRVGGRETAISYGVTSSAYEGMDHDELRQALLLLVPEEHRRFLAGLEDLIVLGDYAFVHAGVDPSRMLNDQPVSTLRWIRSPFLDYRGRLEKTVVHGHTMSPDVEWRAHRIGIDTGAYKTGRLSALALHGNRRWVVQVSSSLDRDGNHLSVTEANSSVACAVSDLSLDP